MASKDRDITLKSRVIYRSKGDRVECDEGYIGEYLRTFGERLKEHLRAPSSIYYHANTSCHHTKLEYFSIVGRKSQTIVRTIKEIMFIRVNDSSLNRNICKYQLSHVWDEVLFNTLTSILNRLYLTGQPVLFHKAHSTSPPAVQETYIMYLQYQHLVSKGSCNIPNLVPHILAPGASFQNNHNQ